MCVAGFPEPKTFSSRVARLLRDRVDDFDIAHDNQVLGYGMLEIEKMGLPLLTTIHHPITFDRRIDIAATRNPWRKLTLSRWYGFLRMQKKVAQQARFILTPSEASKRDIAKDFGVDPARMQVLLLGVDDGFQPPDRAAAGPGPDPGDGQRRRPDEGHRHAARGVRQAAHRARRRADPGHRAASRAARPRSSSTSSRSRTPSGSCTASATPSWSSSWAPPRSPASRRSTRASRCRPPS